MSQAQFVVWHSKSERNSCVLKSLIGVEKPYHLQKGVAFGDDFPEGVVYRMDPELPSNMLLLDNVRNFDSYVVVSEPLMDFVSAKEPPGVEFHRISIENHKGRSEEGRFYLLHATRLVDCLNAEESGAEFSRLGKGTVRDVKRLVIHEDRIEPETQIFKINGFWRATLVRRSLAEEISDAGFTGIRWKELEAYET